MKYFIIVALLFGVSGAFATSPSTSCPSGYIAINEEYVTIATACPSGTVSTGTAESCLGDSPSGNCIMYAPAGISYTEDIGTYEFIDACAMTN